VAVAPEGRRLLRLEARNSQTPDRKEAPVDQGAAAHGPGIRGAQGTGRPREPALGLRYATVTGVARDDLRDGAAWLYAETCRQIHFTVTGCGVELLIPDFNAGQEQLALLFAACPEVLAHNIETVPRIFRRIRPAFRYRRSLEVLARARDAGLVTKSNLILGLGEERHEVAGAMRDLRDARRELLTITQYLRPSVRHHPVERWGDSPPPSTPWFRYGGGRSRMSLHIAERRARAPGIQAIRTYKAGMKVGGRWR
jgi:radical SAM family protein